MLVTDSCVSLLFLPHLDVISDLLLNKARQHGIYLLSKTLMSEPIRFADFQQNTVYNTSERIWRKFLGHSMKSVHK